MSKERKKRDLDNDDSICPECQGPVVTDHDRAEMHCETCGLVINSDLIDLNTEYRIYDNRDASKERVGPRITETLHDRGLSTEIDSSMRDSHGRSLNPRTRREMHRLRKLHKKVSISNSQERNLIFALTEITRKSSHLGITDDVKQETAHLYRRAVEENVIRGRSITAVMAASFYLAGRICGHPRTIDEISQEMGVSRKECGRIYRFLKRKFGIKLDPPTGDDFIERFCLDFDPEIIVKARSLLRICEESGLYSGKAPMGIVAAVIYTAMDDFKKGEITQNEVAKKCSVTEVTLRNRCKDIQNLLAQRRS